MAVLLVLAATAALSALIVARLTAGPPARVALKLDGQTVATVRVLDDAGGRRSAAALARSIPPTVEVREGRAKIVFALQRTAAAAALERSRESTVVPPARVVSSSIGAPVVAQRLRNNCETAALQVLLATTGVDVDQLTLQGQLVRSGTPDPVGPPSDAVWGDPDQGYVGRADGLGPAGGFGVYPRPISALAARHGRRLRDLTGSAATAVYDELRRGRAVMAWVGLGDGPYRSWRSPAGRRVTVNMNEHTVVVTGLRADGSLDVVNVLQGTREVWSKAQFERGWQLLGRRGLATT